jgi:hypothetical protein
MKDRLVFDSTAISDFVRISEFLIQYYTVEIISITWDSTNKEWKMVATFN